MQQNSDEPDSVVRSGGGVKGVVEWQRVVTKQLATQKNREECDELKMNPVVARSDRHVDEKGDERGNERRPEMMQGRHSIGRRIEKGTRGRKRANLDEVPRNETRHKREVAERTIKARRVGGAESIGVRNSNECTKETISIAAKSVIQRECVEQRLSLLLDFAQRQLSAARELKLQHQ